MNGFADDTTLQYSNNILDDLVLNVNHDLIKFTDFFNKNKLSLNTKKNQVHDNGFETKVDPDFTV